MKNLDVRWTLDKITEHQKEEMNPALKLNEFKSMMIKLNLKEERNSSLKFDELKPMIIKL